MQILQRLEDFGGQLQDWMAGSGSTNLERLAGRFERREVAVIAALCGGAVAVLGLGAFMLRPRFENHLLIADRGHSLVTFIVLAVLSAGLIFYEHQTLGPTMAKRRGGKAALFAWILVFPLGWLSGPFVAVLFFAILILCGVMLSFMITQRFDGSLRFASLPVFCVFLFLASNKWVLVTLTRTFGAIVIFVSVYFMIRLFLVTATDALAPLPSWTNVEAMDPESEEYKRVVHEFEFASLTANDKYEFWLKVISVRKATRTRVVQRTSEGRSLFHGTPREKAQAIVADGFRLPNKAGMFGKGIYFADCPLKSFQYTDGTFSRSGVILMCWVELGNSKHAKRANNNLTKPPRRSLWQVLRRKQKYESVVGDDAASGGVLRVPEFVVYDPARVEVDFVLEVQKTAKGESSSP